MSLLNSASLVVTPNAYKEGTLYSVIPNTTLGDMTVVRATTATRVNSAGLIELVPYNLVTYSEQFNNADWTKGNGTITANATTSPDGTANADKFAEDSSTDAHYFGNDTASATSGQAVTFTIFAKASERSWIALRLYSGASSIFGWYNIGSGTLGTIGAGGIGAIDNAENGWYRCSLTITMASNSVCLPYVFSSTGNGTITFAGTSGSGFFAWGAQLNEGSTAKDYLRTETRLNIPRLDYSNGTCPSILVEPQRSNLMTYSEQLDNAAWTATAITVTANATTSPDGTTNADKLIPTNVSAFHNVYNYAAVLSGNYSFSVFVKKGGYNFVSLQDQFSGVFNSCFDLVNGTVTTFVGSSNIKSYGNDWFLCSVTGNGVGTTVIPSIVPANAISSFPVFTGNGTDGIFAWGAQFEAGTYPTSYIPTTSAAVTRNADFLTRAGFGNTSTSGTLFFDLYAEKIESSNGLYILQLFAGSSIGGASFATANGLSIIGNGAAIQIFNNGYTQQVQTLTPTAGQRVKLAIRYNGTNVSSAINGTLSNVFADTAVGVKNALRINNGENGTQAFNVVCFFPSYLTDSELASLTT